MTIKKEKDSSFYCFTLSVRSLLSQRKTINKTFMVLSCFSCVDKLTWTCTHGSNLAFIATHFTLKKHNKLKKKKKEKVCIG